LTARRVTQADVAERAGVSPTTVSLVLNGAPGTRFSEAAIERVYRAAEDLGYRPNLTARALSTRRTHAIGLVSDKAAVSPEASALMKGALRAAREKKYTLFIAETDGDPNAQREAIDGLVDRGVEGLLYAVSRSRLVSTPDVGGAPLVLLNARGDDDTTCVLPDEHAGGRAAVEELVRAGHQSDIAVIGAAPPRDDSDVTLTVRRRLEGMWAAFDEHGITPHPTIECPRWELDAGAKAAQELLAAGPPPKALVCMNDRLAYRAIHQAGYQIPEDISVVSFDDDVIAQYLEPQLTSIALPYTEMGELAIQLLLGHRTHTAEHLVPMPAHARASIRPFQRTRR
jgi:LacI family transcriptional regulator